MARCSTVAMSYSIFDRLCGRARYIPKAWETEEEANAILAELLKHYPPGTEWHRRLFVGPWQNRRTRFSNPDLERHEDISSQEALQGQAGTDLEGGP